VSPQIAIAKLLKKQRAFEDNDAKDVDTVERTVTPVPATPLATDAAVVSPAGNITIYVNK
jgi:hypothetical protein